MNEGALSDSVWLLLGEAQIYFHKPQIAVFYQFLTLNFVLWCLYILYKLVIFQRRQLGKEQQQEENLSLDSAAHHSTSIHMEEQEEEEDIEDNVAVRGALRRKREDGDKVDTSSSAMERAEDKKKAMNGTFWSREHTAQHIKQFCLELDLKRIVLLYLLGIFILCVTGAVVFVVGRDEQLLVDSVELVELDRLRPDIHHSRSAVFGLLADRPVSQLKTFVSSLRRTGSTCRIFIVTNDPEPYIELASQYHANLVRFQPGLLTRLGQLQYSGLRFFIYKKTLEMDTLEQITHVMVADVADVFFQRDPFQMFDHFNIEAGLLTFYEESRNRMALPGTNAGWLKLCFGYTVAHSFEGSSISCSGTTLGTRPVMEQYLNYQTQFSTQHPLCGVQGVDQSIHNYIISKTPLMQPVYRFSNEKGPIFTMDNIRNVLFEESSGLVLNQAGVPYYVVHQINRCYGVYKHTKTLSGVTLDRPQLQSRIHNYVQEMCSNPNQDGLKYCDDQVTPINAQLEASAWSCSAIRDCRLQKWYSVDE